MRSRPILLALAVAPFVLAAARQESAPQEPTCEQVFKNIQVFKGVPASDLIPSMEFMSGALKFECSDCHDEKDFSKDTRAKGVARKMILMQRDINEKNFGGRTQVTCMTCHRGSENPVGVPLPDGIVLRHPRTEGVPKPEELFTKAVQAAGKPDGTLVRTGTLTAPNDMTHKVETAPVTFTQEPGGKFSVVASSRQIVSDGSKVTYDGQALGGEPAFVFERLGRTWRGDDAYAGLDQAVAAGKDKIGKADVWIVRAARPATTSSEELSFDAKSNLLLRLVNMRRSSLGTVVSAIDYANYAKVGGARVPMKVIMSFAGGQQWIFDFKSVSIKK
ncbi:MAG TPA: photosynthetic reaction center cytochrome c subunit family protein [Fimbriimonadaceae bacterium]|nr:photosynthetic reaction center cytochrome c subunit family protein [Fimbriimonadaceae bacterium]